MLGGFCYFDGNKTLIQTNALTLDTSPHELRLVGPYTTAAAAATWMERSGRLAPVTLKQLSDGGFKRFGWVLPDEQPGGHALSAASVSHSAGAFAYQTESGASIFYIVGPGANRSPTPTKTASGVSAAVGAKFGVAFGAVQKLWGGATQAAAGTAAVPQAAAAPPAAAGASEISEISAPPPLTVRAPPPSTHRSTVSPPAASLSAAAKALAAAASAFSAASSALAVAAETLAAAIS